MNAFKIRALFAEFAFLVRLNMKRRGWYEGQYCDHYLHPSNVTNLRVARVSKDLLGEMSFQYYDDNREPSSSIRYFLIDENGNLIFEVDAYFIRDGRRISIGEELLSLPNPDTVKFIVSVHELYDDENMSSVVVYKPPKGFTLTQWVQAEEESASEWARRKVIAVDEIEVV